MSEAEDDFFEMAKGRCEIRARKIDVDRRARYEATGQKEPRS